MSGYVPSAWGAKYHATTCDEVLGGGSAGPGKSLVLLMDPMTQIAIEHARATRNPHIVTQDEDSELFKLIDENPIDPGTSTGWALHLRRTIKDLKQTIVRSQRLFSQIDPTAVFDKTENTWKFSSGYHYQFGHCQNPDDWKAYLGSEYCAAGGTGVLMADGSFKSIEDIQAGEYVQTLQGPKRVTATWDTGRKPCVSADVQADGIGYVGTQLHPTTHPVLLCASEQSPPASSRGIRQDAPRSRPHGFVWQDYESLLAGRPESPVKRVSSVGAETDCEGFGDSPQAAQRLPALTVRAVLHAHTVRRASLSQRSPMESGGHRAVHEPLSRSPQDDLLHRQDSPPGPQPSASAEPRVVRYSADLFVCGGADELLDLGTPRGLQVGCSSLFDPRDEQPRSGLEIGQGSALRSAYVASPGRLSLPPDVRDEILRGIQSQERSYPHFYSGESLPRSEAVHTGAATLRFAGWHQTYDLTVDGANHYITETGLINAQTYIGFDELVTFLEEQYDNITTRLRSSDPVLRHMLKVRSMSNPVVQRDTSDNYQIDPLWVRKRFVDFNPQGNEIQVFQSKTDDGKIVEKTLLFLPAKLSDNPDPAFVEQYTAKLMFAKPHIRAAMLHGNWYITAGSFYGDEWNQQIHVIKPHRIPGEWRRFRSMDWGYKKPGCIHWYAMDEDGNLVVDREFTFQSMTVKQVAKRVKEIEEDLGLWKGKRSLITGPADTQLWEKRGEEGLSKYEEFQAAGVPWIQADKRSRMRNAERIAERLKDHRNGTTRPGLVFFDSCKMIIQTLPTIQTDSKDPDLPADGGDDHWHDSLGYGVAFASRGAQGIPALENDDKDEYDDETEKVVENRGNWGYGSW